MVSSVGDLLADLGLSGTKGRVYCKKESENILNSLEKAELMVYSCFGLYAKNMEELLQMTNIPVQKLASKSFIKTITEKYKTCIKEFFSHGKEPGNCGITGKGEDDQKIFGKKL